MRPLAGMVDLPRTAGLPAIRVVVLSAVRGLVPVSRRILSRVVPFLILRFPHEVLIEASAVRVLVCESELMASETTATTTATAVADCMGMRVHTIHTGGGILVRRSTMTSNTRRVWPTR